MEIRRIGADEWGELRDLRLRALQDAPDAFGSTYEEESIRTDAEWMEWAADARGGRLVVRRWWRWTTGSWIAHGGGSAAS